MTRPPSREPGQAGSGARGGSGTPTPLHELLLGLMLLMVALVWGSIFFMTKDFITRVPQLDYLSIRYLIAGAVGAIAFAPRLRRTGAAT